MDGRMIDFIGNDHENASSIKHAQVMRRAMNIILEMQGILATWINLHVTLDIGAVSLLFHKNKNK